MNKEKIVEEVAEGICQYSNTELETKSNTIEFLTEFCKEVCNAVDSKVQERKLQRN
tara:strand:- start:572 stop:739 length:168 start_codon:yes stop_codon:yes gene_type:complete